MRTLSPSWLAFAASSFTVSLVAQSTAAPATAFPSTGLTEAMAAAPDRVPVHAAPRDAAAADQGLWAAGADYKAHFADGITFFPLLGRDYPHDQPFTWRTTSVRVGTTELLDGRTPLQKHGSHRVEYAHAAFVEAYDVLANGLEQTFVLHERPAAVGDLRITGAVTSALWAAPVEAQHGDLVFRDARGQTILRYGAATAIDRDGDRFAMTTTVQDGAITLQLAAADLQRADFPLVVDPLLATNLSAAVGAVTALGDTDCACETLSPSVTSTLAFTKYYSATDTDVVACVSTVNLLSATVVFSDLLASTSVGHPRLAHFAASNRWLLVMQNLTHATQIMQLRAVTFPGGTYGATPSTALSLPVLAGVHDWRPVVSGIAEGGTGTEAMVVFQREVGAASFVNQPTSQVMGVFFDTATVAGSWGTPFTIRAGATFDHERPAVNRMADGGVAFSRLVCWQSYDNTQAAGFWNVQAALVTDTGLVSATPWTTSAQPGHELGPVVDGRNGRFCLAYAAATTPTGKLTDVLGTSVKDKRLNWAHGDLAPAGDAVFAHEGLQTNAGRVLETTGIAHNGGTRSHWAITWRVGTAVPAIEMTRVGFQGKALQVPDVVSAAGATQVGWASVLHHGDFGGTTLCWMEVVGTTATVYCRQVAYTNAFATVEGVACGPGGLTWAGPAVGTSEHTRIGSEFSGPKIIQAYPNGLHLMLVATAPANLPISDPLLVANCTLLVPFGGPDYLGMLPLQVGNAVQWQLPLPETLPPVTLYFQDWVLDPATNLLSGTRRLVVPLTK